MNNYTQKVGLKGEDLAEDFLLNRAFKIITKNYHSNHGEIDIIAQDQFGDYVFVEVKTRSSQKFGKPQDAVTKDKIKKLKYTALKYLQSQFEWEDMCWRIDIVEVYMNQGRVTVNHIEDIK